MAHFRIINIILLNYNYCCTNVYISLMLQLVKMQRTSTTLYNLPAGLLVNFPPQGSIKFLS